MATTNQKDIDEAVLALQNGQVIAYPTESVYGLGCDPKQPKAIEKVIHLKQRQPDKGLILIASNFEQLKPYIADIDDEIIARARATWPGPVTWVWPINESSTIYSLLHGRFKSVAVRVSAHPVVVQLCNSFGGAIVSTSANRQGKEPARTAEKVRQYFSTGIAKIINADVGNLSKPTEIYDLITQAKIR